MCGLSRQRFHRTPRVLIGAAVTVLILGIGVGGAAVCRFTSLNCHLGREHSSPAAKPLACTHGQCYTKEPLQLPNGFHSEGVVRNLSQPTSFVFLRGGRIL